MVRIRRWVIGKRKKVIWSEPRLPPFIKINPESPPGLGEGQQPGDLSKPASPIAPALDQIECGLRIDGQAVA